VKIIARDKVYEFSEIEPHGKPKKIVFFFTYSDRKSKIAAKKLKYSANHCLANSHAVLLYLSYPG
jgi:hypothetical protein